MDYITYCKNYDIIFFIRYEKIMPNPFVKNFEQLFQNIEEDIRKEGIVSLYVAKDSKDSIFLELLVQPLEREVEGVQYKFLAVRNIKIKEEYKGQGLFNNFVQKLETLGIPILYHDVVNDKLPAFFMKKNYKALTEVKYDCEVVSYYNLLK